MKYLINLTILLSLPLSAKVVFHGNIDEAISEKVSNILTNVKAHYKEQILIPRQTHVTNKSYVSTMYDAKTDTLNIASYDKAPIVHELGHQVFDQILEKEIDLWRYFKVRNSIRYRDINQELKKEITSLKKWKIASTSRPSEYAKEKIKELTAQVKKLQRIQALDKRYKKIVDSSNIFKRVTPYQELFADALAINYFNEWDIVYRSALEVTGNPVESEHRKFPLTNPLNYVFSDPYSYFGPFKSFLRNQYKSPRDFSIPCITKTLIKNIENDLLSEKSVGNQEVNYNLEKDYTNCLYLEVVL